MSPSVSICHTQDINQNWLFMSGRSKWLNELLSFPTAKRLFSTSKLLWTPINLIYFRFFSVFLSFFWLHVVVVFFPRCFSWRFKLCKINPMIDLWQSRTRTITPCRISAGLVAAAPPISRFWSSKLYSNSSSNLNYSFNYSNNCNASIHRYHYSSHSSPNYRPFHHPLWLSRSTLWPRRLIRPSLTARRRQRRCASRASRTTIKSGTSATVIANQARWRRWAWTFIAIHLTDINYRVFI